ncbi:MAG TPA: hypothetical protein VGR47_01015 [Terracidiphilus sp.]|nr:hypothetical protein [Terracidiphilus sp.]
MASRNGLTTLSFSVVGFCLLLISPGVQAQQDETSRALAALAVKDGLQPAKAAFLSIDRCRIQLPAGDLKEKFTEAESRLAEGLLIGWGEQSSWQAAGRRGGYSDGVPLPFAVIASRYVNSPSSWVSKPPPLYLQSLQNDAAVCNGVVPGSLNAEPASSAIQGVIADLIVKAKDCLSEGMGRLVGIQISTKRGKIPDPGWTVYYKWVSVSDIPTAETAFQTSSTPAKDKLPPGIYQFRAEKSVPGSPNVLHSEIKMVPLDAAHDRCELQVP